VSLSCTTILCFLNQNSGAIVALSTAVLLVITSFYALTTYFLLREAKRSREWSSHPKVVAYLRLHSVHPIMVQLHIANLAGAAAIEVSVSIEKLTDWPPELAFEKSNFLKELEYLHPNEIVKSDIGRGPEMFKDGEAAKLRCRIIYKSLNNKQFEFVSELSVATLKNLGNSKIYGIDDVARQLKEIADVMKRVANFDSLKKDDALRSSRRQKNTKNK